MDKWERQLIARLEQEVADMQTELAALVAAGKTNDLKAMFLREGIEATSYRLTVERAGAAEPKRDMRFVGHKPLRKAWRDK